MLYFENKINIPFMQMVSATRGCASRLKFCGSFTFRWCFWLGQNALDTQLLLQSNGTSAHKADNQLFSCSTDCLDSHATKICESAPLKTSSQMLFKCIKPFLATTDVALYTAFLKVSDNETERWNCNMLHLVSFNFGKTPLGKMDSMKVEPIHALQSRCQALWMTT